MDKKIKEFLDRPSVKKDLFLAFFVALILLAIEGIRKAIELIINQVFYGATIKDITDNYSFTIGYLIAILITIYFIKKYSNSMKL